ncbi:MAG: PKD domain-containing protein [Bacteroidia bacterium]|nr:PKD domain-containing protein [Bacteroidia bacterium]
MIKRLLSSIFILLGLVSFTIVKAQTADFTANKVSGCSPLIVKFTDLSSGGGGTATWKWDFGNGNTSTVQNPTETYTNPGTYTVKLTYKNANTKTKTAYITVFSNPVAKFSSNDTAGCFPYTVKFTDLSTKGSGNIVSWNWTFGDGSPASNSQNPTHTYVAAQNYSITLTVTDINGCQSTFTKTSYIKVASSNLTPAFTSSPVIGCKTPANINFTNTTTGTGPITYSWSFGDSKTSTTTNPSNSYASSGTYTVTLTASTSGGCSKTATSSVTVLPAIKVDFTASDTVICQGSTIAFTDLTTPAAGSWSWNFGDGGTSTSKNPSHPYATAGTYAVKLRVVISGICPDSITKTAYIKVNPRPVISFTADSTHACSVPFTVNFTDNTPGATGWQWYFGDGGTSTSQNPTHIYNAAGLDSVKLVVTTAAGCKDSLTKLNYIRIIKPSAQFTTTPKEGCVPLTVNFTDNSFSTETITSWLWDFGDPASGTNNTSGSKNPVHVYNNIGTYNVTLTITNAYGCTATITKASDVIVTDKPVISFTVTPANSCALTPVVFDGSASAIATKWIWDFGDGQGGGGSTTTHLYSDTGTFNVTLIVYNVGCADTLVKNQIVHISPAVPKFTVAGTCTPVLRRTFTNQSMGADKWYWNFGDGSPVDSVNYNVTHNFPAAGSYTVKLTALNNKSGCRKDTTLLVKIVDLIPNFSISPKKGCKPLPVTFTDKTTLGSGGGIQSYSWSFGDGTSSTLASPSHTYANPGLYTIKFYVTDNSFFCTDSVIKIDSVLVYDITPDFYVKSQTGCDSLQVVFRDTSKTTPAATAWAWTFGDGKTSTQQHPVHYYTNTGTYSVSLTVTNADGSCSVTKNNIVVYKLPTAAFTANSLLTCPGSTVTYSHTSTNANKYTWDFGDGSALSNLAGPTHSYTSNGSYTIKLTATDSVTGCSHTLTKTNYVVIDKPKAGFKTSVSASTCPPLSVTFVDTSTSVSPIVSRYWDFGNGIAPAVTNDTASNTYTAAGKYTVMLIVTTQAGCKDTISKIDLVIVNGPSGTYSYTPKSGCVPFDVKFTITAINTKTDSLTFGDGNVFVGDTCCITHTYENQGIKKPVLTLIDSAGCRWVVPSTDSVVVSPFPNSDFTYSPQYPRAGNTVQFTDKSVAGVTWVWDFGDGTATSSSTNPTHAFSKSGIYWVQEIVDNNGCIDTALRKIIIIEDLVVPNVFTPNNDGINETFTLQAYGVTNIDARIFDRWGLEVFNKAAEKIFWDGRTNAGLEVPAGTYYYLLDVQTIESKTVQYKGFLQLLR